MKLKTLWGLTDVYNMKNNCSIHATRNRLLYCSTTHADNYFPETYVTYRFPFEIVNLSKNINKYILYKMIRIFLKGCRRNTFNILHRAETEKRNQSNT